MHHAQAQQEVSVAHADHVYSSSNAAWLCTGLLGANFAQILLNLVRFDDPITRGLSTSSAAHGLGTAAMAGS